jgi:hypothetical protein
LPDELRQTMQKVRRGQLEMLNPDVRDSARLLYLAVHQVLFALLALVTGAAGWWWSTSGDAGAARYAYGAAVGFSLLFVRAWRRGGRLWRRMAS